MTFARDFTETWIPRMTRHTNISGSGSTVEMRFNNKEYGVLQDQSVQGPQSSEEEDGRLPSDDLGLAPRHTL